MNTVLRHLALAGTLAVGSTQPAITAPAAAPGPEIMQSEEGARSAPVRGSKDAPVTVVVFADFESEICARMAVVLHEVLRIYPEQVRVVFRHAPQPDHPNAPLAHEAALAAAEQGKFWEMHDLIFANQDRLQRGDLSLMAAQLGLDVERFDADRDSGRFRDAVAADREHGVRAGAAEIPTLFLNGRVLAGYHTVEELKGPIEQILRK